MEFEWDERKARANVKKHGVSFHDAATDSAIPLRLPFQIPTIPKKKSGLLRLDCRNHSDCLWSRILFEVPKHGSSVHV